jgi:hypothetical protein
VFLVNAALRLRRFLLRAADAVVPPYLALLDRFMGAPTTMMLHCVAQLRIADLLQKGPLDAATLAQRTGTDPDVLLRVLRALVAVGIFVRNPDGRFANNRVSSGLLTGTKDNIRGFVEFFGLPAIIASWNDLPRTLRDGVSGFERVNGHHPWVWMSEDATARSAFVEGMSSMTEVVAPAIAAAYPFGEVQNVCDVGGGVGLVLAAILRRHPHLRGVLFDHESMLGEASSFLSQRGIAHRVDLVAGSFFESVPKGADAYLLKTVVHNWDDRRALQILRNCRAAMQPGHRLLVADFLDGPEQPSTLVPFMDITGLMVFGGRERTPEAMAKLFASAGFRFDRVLPIPGSQAVFEGIAVA